MGAMGPVTGRGEARAGPGRSRFPELHDGQCDRLCRSPSQELAAHLPLFPGLAVQSVRLLSRALMFCATSVVRGQVLQEALS